MPEYSNTSFLGSTLDAVDDKSAEVMVNIDRVSMIFNIANEQLNSLKEYAIAFARHELRFKEFRALDNISLQIRKGDVFGILGTNGSGKSTLMKIIAGVLEPSEGTCTINGTIAPLIELGAGFDIELTARENIYLNGALLGYSKKFIDQHFEEIVDFAEVRQFLDMPLKNYSSGMVARIAFAIATVIVPDILIVDEVLSVGDFMFQQKCEQRIQSLIKDHGVTVLLVSHSNDQIRRLCNKAVWIEKGHLRAIGDTNYVCQIYQAIGGRTGSVEAEKKILAAIETLGDEPKELRQSLFGEDRYDTAVKLNEFAGAPTDAIILTNSDAELENRIATGLAGVLDASLLTCKYDQVPGATLRKMCGYQPSRIIVIGNEQSISHSVLKELSNTLPDTTIEHLESNAVTGAEAYLYGLRNGVWGNIALITTSACLEPATVALTPYLFSCKMPVFYISNVADISEDLQHALGNFETLLLIGSESEALEARLKVSDLPCPIVRLDESNPFASLDEVQIRAKNDFANKSANRKSGTTLVITSPRSDIDNHLIGPFAGRLNASVLLADPQSLDSMASSITYISEQVVPIEEMIFIGDNIRYNSLGKSILARAAIKN